MRYSYATVALPTLTPDQAIDELSAAGYGGVEWKVGTAPRAHLARATAAAEFLSGNSCTLVPGQTDCGRLARRCAEAGLAVVGLCPYLTIGDHDGLHEMVEMALEIGATQIRLQAPRTDTALADYAGWVGKTVEYLAVAEELATSSGVRVVLETHHNTIAPSAALAHQLVSGFDPASIGIIYDIGNAVWEGSERHDLAISLLGRYLHHVHLKNAVAMPVASAEEPTRRWHHLWSPLDDGLVPVPAVLALLRESGYHGWISLEDLSTTRDPVATVRHNAAVLAALPEAAWNGR